MEAAFLDLDKTVIAKASMMAFGQPLYREGLLSRRAILRGLYAQLVYLHLGASEARLERIREAVLTLTKGWDQARLRAIVAETIEEVVEPIIFSEALELIAAHREAGRRVFIVSASPEEIVAPLGLYLGADEVIASRPRVDGSGRYTGEMQYYAYGPSKADAMKDIAAREGIDLAASYAYSDSFTDLPMLEVVGHPVAVNPDRMLLKVARDRGWEVRHFVRPVRLLRLGSVPDKLPAIAWGAGTIVVAGGAVLLWRRGSAKVAWNAVAAAADRAARPRPVAGPGAVSSLGASWRLLRPALSLLPAGSASS